MELASTSYYIFQQAPLPLFEVYLTFDDGPFYGTDDCIAVLNAENVKGTFFMVGAHVINAQRKQWVKDAKNGGHLIGNHSKSHQYKYDDANWMLQDFKDNDTVLSKTLDTTPMKFEHVRLPGANCWRVGSISQDVNVRGHSTKATADLLKQNGYKIYGWDLEWSYKGSPDKSDPIETPQQMVQKVKDVIDGKTSTKTKNKVIILTHDHMFRTSRGNKKKLEDFIDGLKNLGNIVFKKVDQY